MASAPRKRAADPDWETSSALKATRKPRPSFAEYENSHDATFRVDHQMTSPPLADIGQTKTYEAKTLPGKHLSSSFQMAPELRLEPRWNNFSLHTAAARTYHPAHQQALNGSSNLPPHAGLSHPPPAPATAPIMWGRPYKPAIRHAPHPDSRLCQNFHWVPYPLGLLPYDSWFTMHHRPEHTKDKSPLCPACLKERKLTPHMRKMFLVAERLSWEDEFTSVHDKSMNEELNWAVNYELGILDPFVEDPEHVPGGKKSQANRFHPYQNEYEMKLAFKYIFMAGDITETTWALWIGTQLDLQKMLGGEQNLTPKSPKKLHEDGLRTLKKRTTPSQPPEVGLIDLRHSPPPSCKPASGMPTPASSFRKAGGSSRSNSSNQAEGASFAKPPSPRPFFDQRRRIVSYKTLQDFYELLDKIERTSYVGAVFLEAYAEKLRDDLCKDCWLKRNINLDLY